MSINIQIEQIEEYNKNMLSNLEDLIRLLHDLIIQELIIEQWSDNEDWYYTSD